MAGQGVMRRPRAIVTDIEGTTTPIAFVRDVLFPFARARLEGFIAAHGSEPEVAGVLAQAESLVHGTPVLQAFQRWMDDDAKVTPLKTLQGLIWDDGYRSGVLKGVIYPDVPPVLRRWHAAGVALYVYSSGSEAAQKLIFRFSDAGDLAGLFSGYFDTRIGAKRAAASYKALAHAIDTPEAEILFLSDIGAELDAAATAGLQTCQLVRAEDGTQAWPGHRQAVDFSEIPLVLS
jgi:enolase-phosphatase E1